MRLAQIYCALREVVTDMAFYIRGRELATLSSLCFRALEIKDKKELVHTYSVYKVSAQNPIVCDYYSE